MWAPNADTGGSTQNFTPVVARRIACRGLDGYSQSGPGWGLCNFRDLFGQSFTEIKSLTALPVFISQTDLAPLSTSQDCNGSSYQTITNFISDLFSDGGILQFQGGTTALTSAQRSEPDAALAKAPHPASTPASLPAPSPTSANTPATGKRPPRARPRVPAA